MNLFSKLKKLDSESRHVKIGLIGAGKFATMYLAQIKKTPGIKLVAIADIQPDIAKENLKRVDWSEEEFLDTLDTIEKLKPYDDILKPLYIGVLMRVKPNTRAKTDYTQKGYLKKDKRFH